MIFMNKIVVCSKNKSKNHDVKNVLDDFFDEYEILPLSTDSKVSETPMSDEEGLEGCKNRIEDAKTQISDAKLYIAMEGIISKVDDESFLCGWTTVYDSNHDDYLYGCSAKVHIPKEIIKDLRKDERLSKIVAEYMNSTDEEVSIYGTNGMLTNGCYTREDEFTDSLICAISSRYTKKKIK